MKHDELVNFCYSCLIDGGGEHSPITLEEAEYTLRCWREEENELANDTADLTAPEFMSAWNSVYREIHAASD